MRIKGNETRFARFPFERVKESEKARGKLGGEGVSVPFRALNPRRAATLLRGFGSRALYGSLESIRSRKHSSLTDFNYVTRSSSSCSSPRRRRIIKLFIDRSIKATRREAAEAMSGARMSRKGQSPFPPMPEITPQSPCNVRLTRPAKGGVSRIIYPVRGALSLSLSLLRRAIQIVERGLFIPHPEANGKHGS